MEDLSETYHAIKDLLYPKALKEKDLMSHDNPISLKADKSYPVTLADVTFSFGLGAAMDVSLFNDEDDKDDHAFLGTKDTPIVFNTATDAYLKYAAKVSAKANQQVSLADIGFNMDLSASGSAKALYYRKHPNSELVRDAFKYDLTHFKTIFKFEDVTSLEENNALGFCANGNLTCNLKISWSNILSTGISALSSQLPVPVTLDISLVPTLTAEFNVSVTDDFTYLLKKQANDQFLISIAKKKSTALSAALGATIGVQFADPDALGQQVGAICDKIIQSVLGHTITEINDAVIKFRQGKKSPTIQKLFDLFQLDKLPDPIDILTPKLKQLEQDIIDAVKKLATESVSLSFTYQYSRIEETQELLSGLIAGSDLKKYHGDLLRFKTGALVEAVRQQSIPFTLISYLNQKTLTISKSWGLGLTVFNMTVLTSKDYTESKDTVLTNLKGNKKIVLDRTAGYKWQLMKGSGSWMGEFGAIMPDFSTTAVPTLDEFGYTLLLNTVLSDPDLGESDFRVHLDSAALWGAVSAADADKLVTKYAALKGKNVLVEGKLLFPETVMRQLIQRVAVIGWGTTNKQYLSRAMAAAMSYLPDYQLRSTPLDRQNMYTALWAGYLEEPDLEPADYAASAEEAIRALGNADHLAEYETNPSNWTFGYSFAGVIRSNPGLQGYFRDLIAGMVDLQSKIQGRVRYTEFDKAYKKMTGCFKYQFCLAATGYFLLLHANDLGLTKDVRKVLTLSYGPEDNRTVINCSVV